VLTSGLESYDTLERGLSEWKKDDIPDLKHQPIVLELVVH